jgi:hypothetical protein
MSKLPGDYLFLIEALALMVQYIVISVAYTITIAASD